MRKQVTFKSSLQKMADLYAITEEPFPDTLKGTDGVISIRSLLDDERIAIEDHLFSNGKPYSLKDKSTVVVIPRDLALTPLKSVGVLIEFALGIATISGFQPISIVATFSDLKCTGVLPQLVQKTGPLANYSIRLTGKAVSAWIHQVLIAQRRTKGSIHITADRFVRFLKADDCRDGLVDLCISLESLIESQSEIAFRFSTTLAKISNMKNPAGISSLLKELYNLRSKVVHGSDSTKEQQKMESSLETLRFTARTILVSYILFLTNHSKEEWRGHLLASLFA